MSAQLVTVPETSKKRQVLASLFSSAMKTGNMVFGNEELVRASRAVKFRNHNDAVKIDRSELLPRNMREEGQSA